MSETQKYNIAVVDDEQGITELYNDILSDDFHVTCFNEPAKFVAHVTQSPNAFDIVISDYNMPKMNGVEMLRAGKNAGAKFRSIVLSGYLDKQTVMNAVDIGVFKLLEKPCRADKLLETVNETVKQVHLEHVRKDIMRITNQLREFYAYVQLLMTTHLPEHDLNNFAFEAEGGEVKRQMNFESLLAELEIKLAQVMKDESELSGQAEPAKKAA